MTDDADEAPGWDAIDGVLAQVYPGQEPLHWGGNVLPNQDGINGVSAYRDAAVWFLVTYGLSELFDKVSDDPERSGWGFELTMRVAATHDDAPPAWAVRLLSKLGSYVFSSGKPFEEGHRMSPGGPITGSADSRLTGLAFTADPQLGEIDTPNGRVQFLTVVGLLPDELTRMQATTSAEVLDALRNGSPLLVTDPNRN